MARLCVSRIKMANFALMSSLSQWKCVSNCSKSLDQNTWINQVSRQKDYDKKQAIEFPIPTLDRPEIRNYEFDVNCRKLNITLLMTSPPVFLVSATYRQQISCQQSKS